MKVVLGSLEDDAVMLELSASSSLGVSSRRCSLKPGSDGATVSLKSCCSERFELSWLIGGLVPVSTRGGSRVKLPKPDDQSASFKAHAGEDVLPISPPLPKEPTPAVFGNPMLSAASIRIDFLLKSCTFVSESPVVGG
jgi:hypothetical protein